MLILYLNLIQFLNYFLYIILNLLDQMHYIKLIDFYKNRIYKVNLRQFYHHIYRQL